MHIVWVIEHNYLVVNVLINYIIFYQKARNCVSKKLDQTKSFINWCVSLLSREQKALTPPVAARSTDVTWDNGYYGNVDDEVDDEESYEENVQSVQSHSPSPESSTEPPSKKHKRHE